MTFKSLNLMSGMAEDSSSVPDQNEIYTEEQSPGTQWAPNNTTLMVMSFRSSIPKPFLEPDLPKIATPERVGPDLVLIDNVDLKHWWAEGWSEMGVLKKLFRHYELSPLFTTFHETDP